MVVGSGRRFWYNLLLMTTTTLTPSAAFRGGMRLFGRRAEGKDLVALLALLLVSAACLVFTYVRAPVFSVRVPGDYDDQHLQGFYSPEAYPGENAPSYRWTQERSTIVAPGLGRGTWQASVRLGSNEPHDELKHTLIDLNGQGIVVAPGPDQRHFHLLGASSGDLQLRIESRVDQYGADPRLLGVVFFGAELQPTSVSPLPPVGLLVHTLVALALAFLTLRLIGVPRALALLGVLAGLVLLAWGLVANRAPLGLYSVRMLALATLGLLLMAALRWAIPRLFRLGGVAVEPAALTTLLLIVYGSYLAKAGGVLWPYFVPIDIPWHMEKTRRVLTGRIGELWRADSPFHQSVMPDLWGENKPVIPYSPFYHIFSAIWAIFPWALETSASAWSAVLDALRPVMIFFIVRKFGFRDRAAAIAALTYSIIPATFLMHAWGNNPTTNGMWWSLLSITVAVGTWERLRESRAAFIGLTLVLTLNMLFYAVTAVFTTLLFAGVILGLLVTARRRDAWPLALSVLAAIGLSTGIYYWQFVGPILARTIPKFTGAIQEGGKELGVTPITWPEFLHKYVYLLDIYGMYLPLGLGLAGWWLGARAWGWRSLFGLLMTTWLIIAIVFWFIGFRVDMVDKQLFWLMPWMGIGTGIAVDRLLERRTVQRWVVPLLAIAALYLASDALYLWVHRIRGYAIGEGYVSWYQLLQQWW